MRIDVYYTVPEVDPSAVAGRTAVVIDAIRATTSMTEALCNGARAVFPTESTEDALKLAASLGRDGTLLCGERKGVRIEGFDLGNSPKEFKAGVVDDKQLVMSTTNGTRALLAVEEADAVYAAAFVNLSAVARRIADSESLVVLCAGKEDRFSLDDTLCAGHLVSRLMENEVGGAFELNDAAQGAVALAQSYPVSEAVLRATAAGMALIEIGLGADLADCADLDRYDRVPEMRDRMIVLPD